MRETWRSPMDVNAVRDVLHKQPFRPFSLRLADGRELFIPHPDFIAVSPRLVVVINPQTEAVTTLEPLLIVSIESLGAASSPGSQPAT